MLLCQHSNTQAFLFFSPANKPCSDFFMDFINPINYVKDNLVYEHSDIMGRIWRCYSPGAFFIFKIFAKLTSSISNANYVQVQYMLASICLTFLSCLIVILINSALKTKNNIDKILFCLAFLSSQMFLFSFERANIIILSMLLSAFFIFNYNSENKIIKELSLLSLATAFMLKISPLILVLLLIYNKDYKGFIRTIIYSVLLMILPAFSYPRSLETLITFKDNAKLFCEYKLGDSSLLGKGLLFSIFPDQVQIINCLIYFIATIMLCCSFFYKKIWRKVLALVLFIIFIPNGVELYALLYFLPVIILYFNEPDKEKDDYKYLVYFLILFFQIQIVIGHMNLTPIIRNLVLLIMLMKESMYGIKYFKENAILKDLFIKIKKNKLFRKNI